MSRLLVGVEEVAAHLGDPSWCVFDCRHDLRQIEYGAQAYARGHIPGARFMHLDRDLSGPTTGTNGRHPLPDPAVLANKLSLCGVAADTQAVAYDNEGGIFASRFWWLLRWLGHARVAVLDGGLSGWKRAGLMLEEGAPLILPAQFTPGADAGRDMQVDSGYVVAHLGEPDMTVVDARSPERFRGENETLDPVGGRIPGAINRFYVDNLDDDGCFFKPAGQLRKEFDALLARQDPRNVVQQCGSGVTACHNMLAMELAGLHGSRLYVGSWSEWCSDPARPVATGSE